MYFFVSQKNKSQNSGLSHNSEFKSHNSGFSHNSEFFLGILFESHIRLFSSEFKSHNSGFSRNSEF